MDVHVMSKWSNLTDQLSNNNNNNYVNNNNNNYATNNFNVSNFILLFNLWLTFLLTFHFSNLIQIVVLLILNIFYLLLILAIIYCITCLNMFILCLLYKLQCIAVRGKNVYYTSYINISKVHYSSPPPKT